jgi:hypothetical protein
MTDHTEKYVVHPANKEIIELLDWIVENGELIQLCPSWQDRLYAKLSWFYDSAHNNGYVECEKEIKL